MNESPIEWTDLSWNPVSGCSKVSQGCKNCYAERLWPKVAGAEAKRTGRQPREFTDVLCHDDRLYQPLHWHKPRRIFVNSMSDLFHENVPGGFVDLVFAVMALCPQHIFQILTKRPKRMRDYITAGGRACAVFDIVRNSELGYFAGGEKLPPQSWPLLNVWLGVSVEDQATADERIPLLLQTPAEERFVSAEPLLGPIDFNDLSDGMENLNALSGLRENPFGAIVDRRHGTRINWVIAGGESGPHARPSHPDWFRFLRDQCTAAGVPFFFKQWGEWAPNCLCKTKKPHPTIKRPEPGKLGVMFRCRKKAAGRLLDGREHSEFPA